MLEVCINFLCAILLSKLGYYVIKTLVNDHEKLSINRVFYLLINATLVTFVHFTIYKSSFIFNYFINLITYKMIFKIKAKESFIATGILMLLIAASDIAFFLLIMIFSSVSELENNIYVFFISNIGVIIIACIYLKIKYIRNLLIKCYNILLIKKVVINILFIIMILIGITSSVYSIYIQYGFDSRLICDTLIIIIMVIISIIFTSSRDDYNKLSKEYEGLFEYVQNFEEWIEKEQFIRHEYKNQLAVIYSLTNEESVKEKIKESLNTSINLQNEQIHTLKVLPKGGLKGLMYYKTSIAQNNNIDITINVSINPKGTLHKLGEHKLNELSKIIGIYYDNAIEAAKESRKKNILIEIYELSDRVNIVMSNTYNKTSIIDNMNAKGASSKGKGRGNGLYFAQKIIEKNKWIKEKHEIIDKYYIVTLTISKKSSN